MNFIIDSSDELHVRLHTSLSEEQRESRTSKLQCKRLLTDFSSAHKEPGSTMILVGVIHLLANVTNGARVRYQRYADLSASASASASASESASASTSMSTSARHTTAMVPPEFYNVSKVPRTLSFDETEVHASPEPAHL
ncbi:hypothetical protein HZH68_013292 [Vespula germanica]|uniref:Uncharacterized protein n=1 Tax=Vespula germanica TaxID=30212 RepID=A0A834MUY2_VESGE|nr:hypothetical protein HZH68_013292 [Vespula germanica]